jgi:hypothetical protein
VTLLLASTTALATPTTVDKNEFVDSYVTAKVEQAAKEYKYLLPGR